MAAMAAVAAFLLAACSGGDSPSSSATSSAVSTSSSATTTSSATAVPSESEAPSGGADITITAPVGSSNTGFAETELTAAADTPLTITFVNEDTGIPHNVQIFEGTDTTVTPVWAPEGNALINGPAEETYEVPALAAGAYTFNCFAHPAIMVGTLTVA
jgi:plastocyanin